MATKKTKGSKAKTKKSTTKAAKVDKTNTVNKNSLISSLKKWNLLIAVLFAGQAAAILVMSKSVTLPVVAHFLAPDTLASQGAGHTVMALAVRRLFDVNLAYLVAAFLLISAGFHAIIATRERSHYEADLKRGVNGLRWLEYGLTAGIMLATIGLLNGIYDASTLVAIFMLVVLLHLLGYFGETNSVTMKAKAHSFIGLLVAGAGVWVAIAIYLKSAVIYGTGLSHYVYWIDGVIFTITLGLALNTLKVFRPNGKWADYLYGERIFMALSFVAKTALAWLIFAGFLR